MKIWLSKSSKVPIREQLSTQLILGIVSADLAPGERLPSTNQIAHRFSIHANTVRAAYREIAHRGWVEWRQGSGFYVRALGRKSKLGPTLDLDRLISVFFDVARARGHSLKEIQSRITRWFSVQPPDHVLVIEPDAELREILMGEVRDSTGIRVAGTSIQECAELQKLTGALCVALYDHLPDVEAALPSEVARLFLRPNSIAKALLGQSRPALDTVVTVISRWSDFLHWAHTALVAVGIDPDSLDLRDARRKGWERGLTSRSFIITDSMIARKLPDTCRPRVFKVVADESLEELRRQLPAESIHGHTTILHPQRP